MTVRLRLHDLCEPVHVGMKLLTAMLKAKCSIVDLNTWKTSISLLLTGFNLHLTTFNIIQVRLLLKIVSRINLSTNNELCHGCNSKQYFLVFWLFALTLLLCSSQIIIIVFLSFHLINTVMQLYFRLSECTKN